MEYNVITCVMNNFYYIAAIVIVAFCNLIVFTVDSWQK